MKITFHKYQGTGNDFILIDNREHVFPAEDFVLVAKLCDRKFGIGADGLILLENDSTADFSMTYFNSDGNLSSMCGNGARCIVHFARGLGVIETSASFEAVDGLHSASIKEDIVDLEMIPVSDIELEAESCFMNTGSPHYSVWRSEIDRIELNAEAHKIRYNERFKSEGTNVNFLNWAGDGVHMRTYERGVEGETLSCGTGMVAAALYASLSAKLGDEESCKIYTRGGQTEVRFHRNGNNSFGQIHLIGPATFVFTGSIDV